MIDFDKLFNIAPAGVKPSQGKVLISNPLLSDFFFRRSVVLLIDHGEDGAFGLILNKPLDFSIQDVTASFPSSRSGLYLGGPVKTDGIFYIHKLGLLIPESTEIMSGVWWGGNAEVLEELLNEPEMQYHESVRFFLGYSGWTSGQLEEEIENKSWQIADVQPDEIISAAPSDLWDQKVRSLGKHYEPWLKFPADPSFN